MEALFVYFSKASALIAIYFIAYHFLLRKETFFNTNRWYLLAGLTTSALLPLLFIKKYIFVEPKIISQTNASTFLTNQVNSAESYIGVAEKPIDWLQIGLFFYSFIAIILFVKILTNIISLVKLLYNKEVDKKEKFSFVDVKENISPFSFFNYIVFNSNQYSEDELRSILLHEKIHSQEKHSLDVLYVRLFCVVFWFNPFIWMYKKAILQNLEYIADNKASKQIEDKIVYQKALLKVVSHQNCLVISNQFYQSLIKNRIVMLNKNESQKRNSWKYALILPVLTIFMITFQVKTIAQQKISKEINKSQSGLYITTNKNSSDEELKNDAKIAKEKFGITLKYSKIKRNKKGEITTIKIDFKDKNGTAGSTQVDGDEPIKPIYFQKNKNFIGFGKPNQINISSHEDDDDKTFSFSFTDENNENEIAELPEMKELEKLEPLELLEPIEAPEPPEAPAKPHSENYNKSVIISRNNGGKPEVIVNGKKLEIDSEEYKKITQDFNGKFEFNSSSNGPMVLKLDDKEVFKFNKSDIEKITKEALEGSKIQLERMKKHIEKMRPQLDKLKVDLDKTKNEDYDFNYNFNWEDNENSKIDLKKARAEMLKDREEMLKAREEMLKARDEMLKAREEMIKDRANSKTKK